MEVTFERLHLCQEERHGDDPKKVIKEFLKAYNNVDIQYLIAKLLLCAITDKNAHFDDPAERAEIIQFSEDVWYALQAVRFINKL